MTTDRELFRRISEPVGAAELAGFKVGDRVVVDKLLTDEWAVAPFKPPKWLMGCTATVTRVAGNGRAVMVVVDEAPAGADPEQRVVAAGLRLAP
uniref:hypothetical protein n=1 Tax=Herbidospora sakaeratensis TaxID=564415 RepID=UPI000781ACAE|nr:hypothetical protein [Herbidospora sakaeratensis]